MLIKIDTEYSHATLDYNRPGYNLTRAALRLFLTPFVDCIKCVVEAIYAMSKKRVNTVSYKRAVESEKSEALVKTDLSKSRGVARLILGLMALVLLFVLAGCGGGAGGTGDASIITSSSASGSLSLTWSAPTTNTDGTALTNLSGYKVYYGTTSGSYSTTVDVGNVQSTLITGLTPGTTYYFALTAYNALLDESGYSTEVIRII